MLEDAVRLHPPPFRAQLIRQAVRHSRAASGLTQSWQ